MFKEQISQTLNNLRENNLLRHIKPISHNGKYVVSSGGIRLLNLASNDYLGLLDDEEYKNGFFKEYSIPQKFFFGSGSSRLLTGDCSEARVAEERAAELFTLAAQNEVQQRGEQCSRELGALIFNSGYHANTGIVGALGTLSNVIFIVDKLVHASIIDGLKLSGKKFERFRHNDIVHLQKLVENAKSESYKTIVVITEAVFSMDGDFAMIDSLVELKRNNREIVLYVDEAHSFGLFGKTGLGVCEAKGCISDVDIIVAPLGKAAASVGALAVADTYVKEFLINKMRSFIFSTALPQVNFAWTNYFLQNICSLQHKREHLQSLVAGFKKSLGILDSNLNSSIVPYACSSAAAAVELAALLEREGILAPAIRPPTVPPNGSRLRISITSAMTEKELEIVSQILNSCNR